MSLGMVSMKIFGFTVAGTDQGLKVLVVSISLEWDANDVMHIEYSIPFKFLIYNLQTNQTWLGWTVNGTQRSQNTKERVGW